MTIRALNHREIGRRGGGLDGNDDFQIYCCAGCGTFALYNAETLHLYVDPNDFSRCVLYGVDTVTCPSCGATDSFEVAPDEKLAEVESGPWRFALSKAS